MIRSSTPVFSLHGCHLQMRWVPHCRQTLCQQNGRQTARHVVRRAATKIDKLCTTKSRQKIELVVSHCDLCICTYDKIFFVAAHYFLFGFLSCTWLPFWPRPSGCPGLQCDRVDSAVHQSNNRFPLRLLEEHRCDAWAARRFGSGSLVNGARILQTNMCKFVLCVVVGTSLKGGGAAIPCRSRPELYGIDAEPNCVLLHSYCY